MKMTTFFVCFTIFFTANGYSFNLVLSNSPQEIQGTFGNNSFFGLEMAISNNSLISSAFKADSLGTDSGAAFTFTFNGDTWITGSPLNGKTVAQYDLYGRDVDIDGDHAAVSTTYDDDANSNAGATYMFKRIGNSWKQIQKLIPEDGSSNQQFGQRIRLSGNMLVVGAWRDDQQGTDAGAAYIYQYTESNQWSFLQKLTAPDGQPFDHFGQGIGISENTIVISSPLDDDTGDDNGSVYVFRKNSKGFYSFDQKILPHIVFNSYHGMLFGTRLELSNNQLVVSSPTSDSLDIATGCVFTYEVGPESIKSTGVLIPPVTRVYGAFGNDLDLGINGLDLIVSAPGNCNFCTPEEEAAYLYTINKEGVWEFVSEFRSPDPIIGEHFGLGAAINEDHIAISAPRRNGVGSIYLFKRSPETNECLGDINGDLQVGVLDLLEVIASYGSSSIESDLNNDGIVDVIDLLGVISNFGNSCEKTGIEIL